MMAENRWVLCTKVESWVSVVVVVVVNCAWGMERVEPRFETGVCEIEIFMRYPVDEVKALVRLLGDKRAG
jgi:hypothetical protein